MTEEQKKNKEETRQKLIDAVGRILTRDGFKQLGINTVAKEAGVSKVLIYRYFENFNGLLHAFAEQQEFWMSEGSFFPEFTEAGGIEELREATTKLFQNLLSVLLKNKELQEVKRWELFESNAIIAKVAETIESIGQVHLKRAAEIHGGNVDYLKASTAIFIGGIYYLVLRSKTTQYFNGIDIQSEEGWGIIHKTIEQMINKFL